MPASKAFQYYPHPCKTVTWVASGNDSVPLDTIPAVVLGRLAHLAGFEIEVSGTVTLSSGSITGVEMHNAISGIEFFDGMSNRFIGSLADLRVREYLELGYLPQNDTPATTTGQNIHVKRTLWVGPSQFSGSSSDFILPVAAMSGADLKMRFPGLTGLTANATAASLTIKTTALLSLMDGELRIPPAFEFTKLNAGSASPIVQGRSIYTHLAVAKASYAAISAGDYSAFSIDTGAGTSATIDAATLDSIFESLHGSGPVRTISGEPRSATDLAPRQLNNATPTALAASSATVQPVIFSQPGMKISKLIYTADSGLTVRWTGSQTSAVLLYGRILAQSQTSAAGIAARALSKLGLTMKGIKVKTLSKDAYNGPRGEFLPYAVKV